MTEFLRIGEVAKAAGVSVDTLRRWETEGRVSFARRANQRLLAVEDLPALLESIEQEPRTSSARNRLSGFVVSVKRDEVMAQVEMQCGEYRVVSLMSRDSADELGLEPGVRTAAVIKSTNVVVELD